ncbi:MAG TPA: hypothetical protein DCM15_03520 [Cryomorphaceae bacterium]|nr:hypothetical protein [Cryomorphaceae bacterium]HBB81323.1 hypothetical protein [Cryomorphaceae bacterium]|tara:strand:+ start:1986 stop:2489 length:504 start_codon:yes stop_codon:yes gene_type:complete
MGVKNLIYLISFFCMVSCAERAESPGESIVVDPVERQRMYLAQERQILQGYIEQHQLEGIERNGYGMYELSMSEGDGLLSEMGDRIIYSATVYLMDDSGVGQYTDTVELGMSEMEIGLHQALAGMKEGEKKLVLIPSFLARGLAGDLDKVPPQSPLRYDLRLIRVVR